MKYFWEITLRTSYTRTLPILWIAGHRLFFNRLAEQLFPRIPPFQHCNRAPRKTSCANSCKASEKAFQHNLLTICYTLTIYTDLSKRGDRDIGAEIFPRTKRRDGTIVRGPPFPLSHDRTVRFLAPRGSNPTVSPRYPWRRNFSPLSEIIELVHFVSCRITLPVITL